MFKRFFTTSILALMLLSTPVLSVFAAGNGEENGAASSLMEGPFIILAIATLVLMIYYALRD